MLLERAWGDEPLVKDKVQSAKRQTIPLTHNFISVRSAGGAAGAWHAISINKGNYLFIYLLAYLLNNTQSPLKSIPDCRE